MCIYVCIYNKKTCVYIYVYEDCLNKYISATTWPSQTKIPGSAPMGHYAASSISFSYHFFILFNIYIYIYIYMSNVTTVNYFTIFYKLLMWQILISSNMSPQLTSHLCLPIIIWKLLKQYQQFVKML